MRFVRVGLSGLGCGALSIGTTCALLIIWYVLFNNLGPYFDLAEVIGMIPFGLVVSLGVAIFGAVSGVVLGLLCYTIRNDIGASKFLAFIGVVVTLLVGAYSADYIYYRDMGATNQNWISVMYVIGSGIIGWYSGRFWGHWFETRLDWMR